MAVKILIVEDEQVLADTLAYNLKKQGYEVNIAGDGQTAIDTARLMKPNLILLDVMLPIMDGFEVCRILRKEMSTPILMLTARDDEIDRVVGLEVGADDYLTKPFSMRELIARIKALLRRERMIRDEISTESETEDHTMQFQDLVIDRNRREVILAGKILPIKHREFELLQYLAEHIGKVLSRENILNQVWGWEFTGDSRTVDVHIRWLREKIEKDPTKPARIVTVRGAGYRFEG
jgi:DNA-binding response OmpR family regulator